MIPDMKSGGVELTFYVEMMQNVLRDAFRSVQSQLNLSRDLKEVSKRAETRGIRFFTTELPILWKATLAGLETGVFERPSGFKAAKASVLPAFLQGILTRIFHNDGSIIEDPDPYAVQELCQICQLFYKLELPYTPSQEQKAVETFEACERELHGLNVCTSSPAFKLARRLVRNLFRGFDPLDIIPKHGPGSVATGERYNEKYSFSRKYPGLHAVFPYYTYFTVGNNGGMIDQVRRYRNLIDTPFGVSKVILVPKDSRGPRLISSEPLEFQWIQGGLGEEIVKRCESSPLTKGQLNFTHQTINQNLAKEASLSGEFSTLDLKEASDRVSVDLVRALFPEGIFRALMAARSDAAQLPDGRLVGLTKFAPMGSALCFPVLAICVWALSSAAVRLTTGKKTNVFVYGDDLIVPNNCYREVVDSLTSVGLRVNEDKSFYRGSFRESCGMDAFKGVQVTPLRAKARWTRSPSNASQLASYASLMNKFFEKGFWGTSQFLRIQLESLYGKLPYGLPTSGYPCVELSDPLLCETLNKGIRRRWRKRYQRFEYLVQRVSNKEITSPLFGWDRMLKQSASLARVFQDPLDATFGDVPTHPWRDRKSVV